MASYENRKVYYPSPGRKASRAVTDPYVRLAAGILANGAQAARAGDREAVIWLLSDQAELYADAVGLSFPHIQKRVENQKVYAHI